MKKRKLKPVFKIVLLFIALLIVSVPIVIGSNNQKVKDVSKDYTYVNDYIFDNYYPVINKEEKIILPFNRDDVTIYKKFYDKDDTEENQLNAVIYYENIYMQNSGIDYTSNSEFDVIASLSGTVTNVTDDALLGKTIEIRNSNELILTYQSLSDTNLKKGDDVSQGQIIGKSGSCNLYKDNKNGLHFEIYKNGTVINPEKYFNKSVSELIDN